jgi:hypothetical protein
MKVKTAVQRIEHAIDQGNYTEANVLLTKYRRKFGNRHFTHWMRVMIANGLWELGILDVPRDLGPLESVRYSQDQLTELMIQQLVDIGIGTHHATELTNKIMRAVSDCTMPGVNK